MGRTRQDIQVESESSQARARNQSGAEAVTFSLRQSGKEPLECVAAVFVNLIDSTVSLELRETLEHLLARILVERYERDPVLIGVPAP